MHAETAAYLERIDDLRGQVHDLVTGLSAEALNWRPVEGADDHATNSLAVLAAHITGAEYFWIAEVVGRAPPSRDRDAEFKVLVTNPDNLITTFSQIGEETRNVLSNLTRQQIETSREVRGRTVPVRWAILHVIDHTALHLGQMQLTLQLYRSGQGVGSPRWFERLE